MVKMTNDEISKQLTEEGKTDFVPDGALSSFRFDIEENIKDLWDNICSFKDAGWNVYLEDSQKLKQSLIGRPRAGWDVNLCGSRAYVFQESETARVDTNEFHMQIEVEGAVDWVADNGEKVFENRCYNYKIQQKKDGKGCSVEFDGPASALLRFSVVPDMTYVPGTLQGMFHDKEGRPLTDYMSMADYAKLRKEKIGNVQNRRRSDFVNAMFNNEIPFLPLAGIAKRPKDERDADYLEEVRNKLATKNPNKKDSKDNKKADTSKMSFVKPQRQVGD